MLNRTLVSQWPVSCLSRHVKFHNGKDHKLVENPEGLYPVYGSGGVFAYADDYLCDGEGVLFGRKGTIDKPVYVNGKFWNVDTMYFVEPDQNVLLPKYLYYWATQFPFDYYSTNTALPSMTQADIGSEPIALPPLSEQKRIVDELDRELAVIDEFIADQLRLQGLLQERLVSLTFDLATDASNPDRYETGHPFWKTLPKGWTLQKLGWHFMVGNGSTPSTENPNYWTGEDNGIPWFNSSIVNSEIAVNPARYVTKQAIYECHLPTVPRNSLLIGLTGQGKTRGMVTKTGIDATINQHMAFLIPRPTSQLSVEFTQLVLKAAYPEFRFLSDGNGGTKGALTCDQLKQFLAPVPPFPVQTRITKEFNANSNINNGQLNYKKALHLLNEKKGSLLNIFLQSNHP